MAMLGSSLTAGTGATMVGIGGLMSSKGRRPGLSPMEMQSLQTKMGAQQTLGRMFQERAQDPFKYVMPLEEQKYYDQRRSDIYGEGRQQQQQQMMGAMSRTGTLASGASNYNLMRFGQQTLRDQQQFYFQDRANRLKEREGAVQNTFAMGQGVLGSETLGGQMTDVLSARNKQHNVWRNRWANIVTSAGGQTMGYGLGGMAQSGNQIGGIGGMG